VRTGLKRQLGRISTGRTARGVTVLVYHRVGGGSADEYDVAGDDFERQLDLLATTNVVALDVALDGLTAGDDAPQFVVTFDDGFTDVHRVAFPLLRERAMPFTLYLATAYLGRDMVWEGATAKGRGHGLTDQQLRELIASPLCTIGNHSHRHLPPERLTVKDVDECSEVLATHFGVKPDHFAYPWGTVVPSIEPELRARFRSAATGKVGRNLPGVDPMRLRRVPVRRSDPVEFFKAKLHGRLVPELIYQGLTIAGKRLGARP
jgi:peptidoglycan/xylan/chitin deacetylase (PgdA/CDA1 family)